MTDITFRKAKADRALFVLLLVLAALAFAWTFTFPPPMMKGYPGAALFPQLILGALAMFCLSGLWRNFRTSRAIAQGEPAPGGFDAEIKLPVSALGLTVITLAAFVAVLQFVGMEPAVFFYLGGMLYLRTRRPLLALLCALFGTIGVYLIFVEALDVHLPLTFLPRYLAWW
jgi:hypothetical protein